jgi:hypothetical protein
VHFVGELESAYDFSVECVKVSWQVTARPTPTYTQPHEANLR